MGELKLILLYWCRSSDLISSKTSERQKSELAKGYAGIPTPLLSFPYIRLHDWICMYTTLFMYVHYTFNVPGSLLMYQVLCTRFWIVPGFLLPVFCLFWNVPGFKVPGISKKYQVKTTRLAKVPGEKYQYWYFFVQPGKKKPMTRTYN